MINLPNAFSQHFYSMVHWHIFTDSSFALEEVLVYKTWTMMYFIINIVSFLNMSVVCLLNSPKVVVACKNKCVSCDFSNL